MKIDKDFAAVVALVQHRFFDATLIDQLRVSLSFLQSCVHCGGIAQIRRLERYRNHSSAFQINGVLSLVLAPV